MLTHKMYFNSFFFEKWLQQNWVLVIVHGLHSPNFGCKLQITDFTSHLNKFDIAETSGCKHTYNLSGYEHFKITPNKKQNTKADRSSGGITVFYRSSLHDSLTLIKSTKHYIWFKLNNIFFCALYIPPENSAYFDEDIFSHIYEDVLHFQEKDYCFIMVGDFNARTSNKPDFVDDSGNKYINIGQLNNTIEITQRNNFDGEVNKHGNKLIDFCRSTNLK